MAPLDGIDAKLDRAREHLQSFKSEEARFLEHDAYAISVVEGESEHIPPGSFAMHDDVPHEMIHFSAIVDWVNEPPKRLCAIAGDTIQNLRSALDHLAYQLVVAHGGQPDDKTAFPILVPARTKSGEPRRPYVSGGVSDEALALVKAAQPNDGPEHPMFRLRELSNIDKHRLLFVVATSMSGVTIHVGLGSGGATFGGSIPLKANAYLGTTSFSPESYELGLRFADPGMGVYAEATVLVAFGEGEFCQGDGVSAVLEELLNATSSLVDEFRALV